MAIKIIFSFIIMLFTLGCAHADRVNYAPEHYLKNYALSACLAEGYQSEEVKKDAGAIAGGYLEFGSYSLSAHTAVRNLAKQYLAKNYPSKSGQPMVLAKCIDLFHSKALEDIVIEYKDKQDD